MAGIMEYYPDDFLKIAALLESNFCIVRINLCSVKL
jgi:hypothetical protein